MKNFPSKWKLKIMSSRLLIFVISDYPPIVSGHTLSLKCISASSDSESRKYFVLLKTISCFFLFQEYVSHPINAYMLMKRTTVIWQAAKKDILDPSSEELYKEIQEDLKNYQTQSANKVSKSSSLRLRYSC